MDDAERARAAAAMIELDLGRLARQAEGNRLYVLAYLIEMAIFEAMRAQTGEAEG